MPWLNSSKYFTCQTRKDPSAGWMVNSMSGLLFHSVVRVSIFLSSSMEGRGMLELDPGEDALVLPCSPGSPSSPCSDEALSDISSRSGKPQNNVLLQYDCDVAFKLLCFKERVLAWLRVIPKSNFIGDPSGSRGSSVVCSSCCSENLRSCSMKSSMEEVKLRSLLLSQCTTKPPPPVPSSGLNTAESASVDGISDRGRGR